MECAVAIAIAIEPLLLRFYTLLMNLVARQFIVSGQVQGVGYRYFALRAAARHDILGTVCNLPDGRVEVIAEGGRDAIQLFKNELATGPRGAYVTNLEETDIAPIGNFRDFRVTHC